MNERIGRKYAHFHAAARCFAPDVGRLPTPRALRPLFMAHHLQVRDSTRGTGVHRVLRQTAIPLLRETEQALPHQERVQSARKACVRAMQTADEYGVAKTRVDVNIAKTTLTSILHSTFGIATGLTLPATTCHDSPLRAQTRE